MEIWLDTTNDQLIKEAANLGILHGITTNPTSVTQSGQAIEDLLEHLVDIQDGPVAVQVVADNPDEMLRQSELLTAHSPRVIVKIPATNAGLATIHQLIDQNIPVMATAIFEPRQALLAFKAGAHYLAPYVGRMNDIGINSHEALRTMQRLSDNYAFEGKLIAAGIRDLETLMLCADIGIPAVTLSEKNFREFTMEHAGTLQALERFQDDWKNSKDSQLLPK